MCFWLAGPANEGKDAGKIGKAAFFVETELKMIFSAPLCSGTAPKIPGFETPTVSILWAWSVTLEFLWMPLDTVFHMHGFIDG